MDCQQAQPAIAAGLRPGSSSEARAMLGFHVIDCAACSALLAEARRNDALLLQRLLTTPQPLPEPIPPVVPRVRPRWLRWALVGGSGLGVVLLTLVIWLGQPQRTPTTEPSNPTQAIAGGIELGDSDMPALPPSATATATATATPVPTATAIPEPTATPPPLPQSMTILLLGLDRRPGEHELSRSDAMLILHFNATNNQISIMSLPRDLWVPLPDGSRYVKINAAYQAGESAGGPSGGAQTAAETVATLIGQPIDATIVTTFEGLIDMVDTVGGIDVDVPKYIYDGEYPTFDYGYMVAEFVPGIQHMDGTTALIYSRTRHADNDFERGKRQQQVIMALVAAIDTYISNGNDAPILLTTLAAKAEYTNLNPLFFAPIVQWLHDNPQPHVVRDSIDLRYGYETSTIDGAYIIQPDVPAIQGLAAALFGSN